MVCELVWAKRRIRLGMTPSKRMPQLPWLSLPSLPQVTRMRLSPRPYSTCWRFLALSFEKGASKSTLQAFAMPSMIRKVHPSPRSIAEAQGAIAPSRIDKLLSGITSSGSTSSLVPNPLHA